MLQGPKGLMSIWGGFSPLPMCLSKTLDHSRHAMVCWHQQLSQVGCPINRCVGREDTAEVWRASYFLLLLLSGSVRASSTQAHLAPEQTQHRRSFPSPLTSTAEKTALNAVRCWHVLLFLFPFPNIHILCWKKTVSVLRVCTINIYISL